MILNKNNTETSHHVKKKKNQIFSFTLGKEVFTLPWQGLSLILISMFSRLTNWKSEGVLTRKSFNARHMATRTIYCIIKMRSPSGPP